MQHRTDEVPHDCGRRARARLAEQTAVRSRRVRHTDPPGVRHRNAVRTRQSYPTGTSYMVLRRSSYPPNVITTVPKSKYARRYNVPLEPRTRLDPVTCTASTGGVRAPVLKKENQQQQRSTHMPISCEMLSSGGCTCQHLRDQRPSTAHPAKGSLVLNAKWFASICGPAAAPR